jgi:hypothetical protein
MEARLLNFLSQGPAIVAVLVGDGKVLVDRGEGKCIAARADLLQALERRGLICREAGKIRLTQDGVAKMKRDAARKEDAFQVQHREIELRDGAAGEAALSINLNESPLGQISRRKDRQGRAFLSDAELRAGERLRSDYTRGQIMPRLSANWEAGVSSGRRGGAGGVAELTEAALAARLRVEKAIAAVGPELSGVLLDVCCFLKGLETVEAERLWPARSARIVLRAALGALARHYEPPRMQKRTQPLQWGAEDYRPSING